MTYLCDVAFLCTLLSCFREAAGLAGPGSGVGAAAGEEVGVGALFDDAAFFQEDEAVHLGDGG